ncbi:tetratricopeptide repeat protein [Streptomyces sp. NPDC056149]|uniref:ATP-binding protein n=1 Tax=Streptomyces sp. NPDC056149 TaxID=3345728 RepID=UPI0035E137C1
MNRTAELDELNAVLTDRDGEDFVVSVYVIAGTAGAGKTSLALRWSHQAAARFPDGQLYVNLRGYDPGEPVTPHEALHRFLTALGVKARSVPQDPDAAAALFRSLLADRRMLILLDNAATVSQVRPLLPGGGPSLAVVTSRSRLSGLAVRDGARRLTLGTLPEPEAVALLHAVTSGYRPDDDPAKLTELARLCARLPLALRIAAERAASHPHMQLDDLIADLRDESALWDALSTGDDEDADAVRTVFAWSYRALPEPTARLFRLLGLHPGPEIGLSAAASLAGLTTGRTRQLLDNLVGAHLLWQAAPDRYQFHDLLRAYAVDQAQQAELTEERSAALRRELSWYLHTADAAQEWLKPDEDRLPLPAPEPGARPETFPDYHAALDWSEREQAAFAPVVRSAAAAGLDGPAAQLAAVFWNALPPSAPLDGWLTTGRTGLDAAQRHGDPALHTLLLLDLGMAYRGVNRLDESLDCLQRALDLARESGNETGEADALNLIGLVHLRRRQLGAAARAFAGAAELFRRVGDPHGEATARSNLASTHYGAGRLPDAATAIDQALAAHRSLNNDRGVGNALRLAAELHRERAEHDQALGRAQEALEIALALRAHRLEGFWLITLGNVQQARGELPDALTSYHRAAMLHRRLGDRSREALAWQGTGETYHRLDRGAEAADFLRRAAAAHHDLDDPWYEALARTALGTVLAADDPRDARHHWTRARGLLDDYDDPRATATRDQLTALLADTPDTP